MDLKEILAANEYIGIAEDCVRRAIPSDDRTENVMDRCRVLLHIKHIKRLLDDMLYSEGAEDEKNKTKKIKS